MKKDIDFIKELLDDANFDGYDDENPIMIPTKIYDEICRILKSDNIDFMGIT